jgi:hypothetical protein
VTAEQLRQIEDRAKAALTYERTDSGEDDSFECPLCDGDGYIEGQRYDCKETLPATVVAYGIGKGLRLAEEWVENAPSDILALVQTVRHMEAVLQDIAEGECAYGDNCPSLGSRHGECVVCKARKELESLSIKLRWEDL